MNKNIDKMISKIMTDPELREELIWQKSLDDVYEFCRSVSGGYTKKEFEEFLDEVFEYDKSLYEEISDEDMANIAGGADKNMYAKVMAYSLSALILVPSVNVGAASGTDQTAVSSKSYSAKVKKEESFWNKYKKVIIGLGAVGLTVLVGSVIYYYTKDGQAGAVGVPAQGGNKKKAVSTQKKKAEEIDEEEEEHERKPDSGSRSYRWYQVLQRGFENIPIVGTAISAVGVVNYLICDFGSISNQISRIDSASWSFSKIVAKFSDFRKRISQKMSQQELSLNDAFGSLEYLFEEVKGQDKAKEQIKSIVYGILHRKNQAKISKKKYDRGDVLYFVGPSGVGKTLMARGLAKYKILTSNTEPFYISASEVDKDSKETVIDQLFGLSNYGYGGYDDYGAAGGNRIAVPKSLVKYLNNNPDGVVIIDEYDKMWSPALDEIFRTIVDHGVVNVKGQTIDCSGITFILTSNESTKSIEGGNQEEETSEEIDDGTGSRTQVKHDKSFLNRLQPVEFSNLSLSEYSKIIEHEFKEDLVEYWANPEVNGIDIVIDDKCLNDMAKMVEKKNQGARYITKLQSDLFRDISIKVFDAEVKEKDFYRGKKIFVEFNPDTGVFTLKGEGETSQ